ncbi:hypothetical protein CL656_02520 [bacterium]|nr:hypothetical protein [bacterium]|tara:strand:- start:2973 stop:3968 length:996 start_codon:yes stop_codon:yes gene_type:complete
MRLNFINKITDTVNLNYVVKSVIYNSDPNILYLSLRGGGITTFDISNPKSPFILSHWDEEEKRVIEGQDRFDNFMVFADISRGGIFLFDVSDPSNLKKIFYYDIPEVESVLHSKIYKRDGRVYVLLTGGFSFSDFSSSDSFIIVDITEFDSPKLVSVLNTGVFGAEGVYINDNYVYFGGFDSSKFIVIDISDIDSPCVVNSLQENYYSQMVCDVDENGVLYAALWGENGGIASFDISDPLNIRQIGLVLDKKLSRSNRINFKDNYIFLPLELENGGGVGVVDKSDSKKLKFIDSFSNLVGVLKPYCLAIKDEYLYLFSSKNSSMHIFKIEV